MKVVACMKYVSKKFILAFCFLYASISFGDTGTKEIQEQLKTLRFKPTDDAYLKQSSGQNTNILHIADELGIAFLKFNVDGIKGVVSKVELLVHVAKGNGKGHVKVYRGVGNNWSEKALTINSAPIKGGLVGSRDGIWEKGKDYTIDISSLLSGNGEISLVLEMDKDGDSTALSSVEGGSPSELIVTFKP